VLHCTLLQQLLIDGREFKCNTAGVKVTIHREAEIQFSGFVSSDMTWLVFTSHSIEMLCKHGFVKERSVLQSQHIHACVFITSSVRSTVGIPLRIIVLMHCCAYKHTNIATTLPLYAAACTALLSL
jgi:hypothetical protein